MGAEVGAEERLRRLGLRSSFASFENSPMTWSPVTESNRRPSPYHAWRAVSDDVALGRITAGRRDIGVRLPLATSAVAWRRCHLVCHLAS